MVYSGARKSGAPHPAIQVPTQDDLENSRSAGVSFYIMQVSQLPADFNPTLSKKRDLYAIKMKPIATCISVDIEICTYACIHIYMCRAASFLQSHIKFANPSVYIGNKHLASLQ